MWPTLDGPQQAMWQRVGLVVLLLLLTLSAPSPVLARAIPGEELDQATENNEIDHGHEPLTSSTTRMESETTTGRTTTAATTSTSTTTSTTEGLPTFNRNQVSLDLPSDLFTSTVVSELITRTSVRIAQVVRFLQPVFGYHLMIDIPKELDV